MGTPVRAPDPGCRLFFRARLIADLCSAPPSPNRQKRTSATIPPTRRRRRTRRRSRRRTPTTKTPTTRSPSPRRPRLRAKTRRRKRRSPRDRTTTTASTPTSSRTCRATRWTRRTSSREVVGPGRDGPPFSPTPPPIWPRTPTRTRSPPTWSAFHQFLHCSFYTHPVTATRPERTWELLRSRASLARARLGRLLLCGRYPPGGFSLGRSGSRNPKISGISADVTHRVNS